MEKFYLAIPVRDIDKKITGYQVKHMIDKPMRPRGVDCEILQGIETPFPKAVLVDNQWQVIEDATKKDAQSQKENQQNARKAQLIAAINSLDVNTKLTDIVPLMKKLLQHILNQ